MTITENDWVHSWLGLVLEYYAELERMPNRDDVSVINSRFEEMSDNEKANAFHYLLRHSLGLEYALGLVIDKVDRLDTLEDVGADTTAFIGSYGSEVS